MSGTVSRGRQVAVAPRRSQPPADNGAHACGARKADHRRRQDRNERQRHRYDQHQKYNDAHCKHHAYGRQAGVAATVPINQGAHAVTMQLAMQSTVPTRKKASPAHALHKFFQVSTSTPGRSSRQSQTAHDGHIWKRARSSQPETSIPSVMIMTSASFSRSCLAP